MRLSRILVATAALAGAVLLLVLAADALAWRETMRADDLRFRTGAGAPPDWSAQERLPFGLARRLLGVDDDRALRRAVLAFRTVDRSRPGLDRAIARRARGDAEVALARVAAGASGTEASQAQDLLGVLAFADSTSGGIGGLASPVERSVTAFETAVRLDRDNVAAKHNLELVLRLLEARGRRPGSGAAPGVRGGGRRGAGGGTPGRGY
jgi:hypothetical protein